MIYVIDDQAFTTFSRSKFERLRADNFHYYTVHLLTYKDVDDPEVCFYELIFYPSESNGLKAINAHSNPDQFFLHHIFDHDAIELTENHDLVKFLVKE